MDVRFLKLHLPGIVLSVLLLGNAVGDAGTGAPDWLGAERFRELPWGSTLEKALAVYPDMAFVRYAVTGDKETPSKVYERKNEERSLDGIRVDGILYWFRDDTFYKVTAALDSKVGPRTLGTPAAEAFDRLQETIGRLAGVPVEDRRGAGLLDGDRTCVWRFRSLSVILARFEPPRANGEELVLEIAREAPPAPRPPDRRVGP